MHVVERLRTRIAVAVVICGFGAAPSVADVRFGGSAGSLSNFDLEEFAGMAASLGSAHVTLESAMPGLSFGEKLLGQVLDADGFFDVVTGTPTVPLTLDTTIDGDTGVNVILIFGSTAIDGLGYLGFPHRDSIAEGALTALYGLDQRLIAFDVLGSNGGSLRIQFFNRSGAKIGDITIDETVNGPLVFSSDQRDIAAITLTNRDRGGVVYDNFRYIPGTEDGASTCSAGGPYNLTATGDLTEVNLRADVADDPDGDLYDNFWITDCPGAWFNDDTLQDPTLFVDTSAGCAVVCEVTLIAVGESTTDICSATVTISGASAPGVTCPPDMTVESDGLGNLGALDAWLASALQDDPDLQDDFDGMVFDCGSTGTVTVTWWLPTSDGGPCAGVSQCSTTFTIEDTIPPELNVDTTTIVVEDSDCDGVILFDLPIATSSDGATVTSDAPDPFPMGQTTVTYTATDECGLTTTATVDVGLLFASGLDVYVAQRSGGAKGNGASSNEPMVGVAVLVFDGSNGACARSADRNGVSWQSFEVIVAECTPVNSGSTNEDGVARVDVPPGIYLLVVPVDSDGDTVPDQYVGRSVGQLQCGRWKEVDVIVGEP